MVQIVRGLLILLALCLGAPATAAPPALIPMPLAAVWHDGEVRIGADTVVEGRGEAASTADYLARELGLESKRGGP